MNLRGFYGSLISSAAVLSMSVLATGCGSGANNGIATMVSNAQLTTFQQNGDTYAELKIQLSTQSFLITDINLPIVDPHNPSIVYGSISLNNALCMSGSSCGSGAGGELDVSVDLTQAAHLQTVSDTLPNGTAIPIAGLNAANVIALPIGGSGGKVYLDLTQGQAMIGVALPFQELNGVGAYVPGADIFAPFQLNQVDGVVGIFAGSGSGQTGIAVFADLSNVLNKVSSSAIAAHALVRQQAVASQLQMLRVNPSFSQEVKLYNSLSRLNSRGVRLNLQ